MHVLRLWVLFAVMALSALTYAANWDKDDVEIFELQHALEEMEGPGANFYSIMGLKPSASLAQIRKAYREKSLEWHPDKNPGFANAYKRFEHLGLIHKILRDERRDRYDHFLSNGFPKWRGTGYFYERYRPSLALVLVLLVLISVAVQLLVQKLNWRRDKESIENLRRSALALAWGAWFQTPPNAGKTIKPKAPPAEKKVRLPRTGFPDFPPPPALSAVEAGQVDWDEEGEKVRKAVSAAPLTFTEDNRLLDVVVYGDGSLAAYDLATEEWFAVEPLEDKDAPSLRTTWPVTLLRSLLTRHAAQPVSDSEPSSAAAAEPEATVAANTAAPAATAAPKKASARRRKQANKK